MFRIAANHRDKGEEEHHEYENDFAARQPELGLSIGSYGKDVKKPVKSVSKYREEALGSTYA